MKNKSFGSDDVISVYKFMEMCGLHCKTKSNIHISHKIMRKKLEKRSKLFPDSVISPKAISFTSISIENVKLGNIVLVRDDCRNIVAYEKPIFRSYEVLPDSLEKENKRSELIEKQNSLVETLLNGEKITPGYLKYLKKKLKKEIELKEQLEKEELGENLRLTIMDEQLRVSSKIKRLAYGRRY